MSIKTLTIAMITALIALSASFASPARADDPPPPPFIYTYFYDFTINEWGGFTSDEVDIELDGTNYGSRINMYYVAGQGYFHDRITSSGGSPYEFRPRFSLPHLDRVTDLVWMSHVYDLTLTATYVSMSTWDYRYRSYFQRGRIGMSPENQLLTDWQYFSASGTYTVTDFVEGQLVQTNNPFWGTTPSITFDTIGSNSSPAGTQAILQTLEITFTCDGHTCVNLSEPEPDTPEYVRPLAAGDVASVAPASANGAYLAARSSSPAALVHVPVTGTIATIRPLTPFDCSGAGFTSFPTRCRPDSSAHEIIIDGTYFVSLTGNDGSVWEMWVDRPHLYTPTRAGQTIEAGCPIGGSLPTYQANTFGNQSPTGGMAIINAVDGDADINLLIDPEGVEPSGNCAAPELSYDGCITGSRISPDVWDVDYPGGGQLVSTGGNTVARLPHNASMRTLLNVDPARSPVLRLYAHAIGGDLTLIVRYGDQEYSIQRPQSFDYQSIDIDLDSAQPDVGNFFTLEIINRSTGSANLVNPSQSRVAYIGYICLFLDEEPPRETCYFINHDFSDRLEGWDTSDASVTSPSSGVVSLPDGEWIRQQLALNDDATLQVNWGVRDFDNDIYAVDYVADISYQWGGDWVGFGFANRADVTETRNQIFNAVPLIVFAPPEDEPFYLKVDFNEAAPATMSAEIRSVCIVGAGGISVARVSGFDCVRPTNPVTNNIGDWITYLWQNLNYFYRCELMVLLNDWYDAILQFFNTATLWFRWVIVSFNIVMTWLSTDVLFWMNGHLSNIAGGSVTFIEVTGGGQTCNNLWCALDGLFGGAANIFGSLADVIISAIEGVIAPIVELLAMIVGGVFGFILDLAERLVALFFSLIGDVIDLFRRAGSLFSGLVSGIRSAEPTQIEILPYCDVAPDDHIACRGFWTFEQTLFSGNGAPIIPLVIGYLTFLLIMWAMKDIRKAIMQTGDAL